MTRDEALAWTARWRAVAEVTDREARLRSPAARFTELQRLHAFAGAAGLRADAVTEPVVWDRFQAVRVRLGFGGHRPS